MSHRAKVVAVVDDDDSVRKATARLLKSGGYDVQSFVSGEEFLSSALSASFGCLVLDYSMPGINGLELQEELIKKGRPVPIVFITGHGDIPMSVRAMKRGAIDFLPKPFKAEQFLDAIERACAKGLEITNDISHKEKAERLCKTLTPAEYEVMRWVITGMLNKQIADKLGIVEKTVKVHRGRMMQKMHVKSVAELVRLTQRAGITPAIK